MDSNLILNYNLPDASVDSLVIHVPREWLYETLEVRTNAPFNIPLEDLFLVMPSPVEGETLFELKWNPQWPKFKGGKLRIFFSRKCRRPLVLHNKRFNYPNVSSVSARPFKEVEGNASNITKETKDAGTSN